jgi:hypothetical protein
MLIVQFMWSLGLACVDMYSIRNKKDLHNSLVVTLVVIGDWVGHLLYNMLSVQLCLKTCTETIQSKILLSSSS